MPHDWLVAFDDLLTHRLRCCTTCGASPIVYWGIAQTDGLLVAYGVCQPCYGQDPDCTQAVRVLEGRYETAR
jgi:hypothetical protein